MMSVEELHCFVIRYDHGLNSLKTGNCSENVYAVTCSISNDKICPKDSLENLEEMFLSTIYI